jgi:hypothetical protein
MASEVGDAILCLPTSFRTYFVDIAGSLATLRRRINIAPTQRPTAHPTQLLAGRNVLSIGAKG